MPAGLSLPPLAPVPPVDAPAAAVTVDLTAGTASGGAGSDTLLSIENVTGGGFDDTLSGDAGANVLDGAAGADTMAGLPRRVPQANLVPGSAQPPPRQLRIVRDAQSIAAHTEGYFRGWRRGQEIGGFAVGQRDRAAWEFNRDQRAREGVDQRARLS